MLLKNLPGFLKHFVPARMSFRRNYDVYYKTNEDYTVSSRNYDPMHKLTPAFHASVLLLIMNFVITLSK